MARCRRVTGEGRRVQEHVVEQHDLFPVGVLPAFGFGVAGDDRGLELAGAGAPVSCGAGQQPGRARDRLPVPPRPVLVVQQHQPAARIEAGRRPSAVQPDQREQAGDLRLGRHELVEQASQPFGVVDEVA